MIFRMISPIKKQRPKTVATTIHDRHGRDGLTGTGPEEKLIFLRHTKFRLAQIHDARHNEFDFSQAG